MQRRIFEVKDKTLRIKYKNAFVNTELTLN